MIGVGHRLINQNYISQLIECRFSCYTINDDQIFHTTSKVLLFISSRKMILRANSKVSLFISLKNSQISRILLSRKVFCHLNKATSDVFLDRIVLFDNLGIFL